MPFNFFDIHSHLYFPEYDKDRIDIIKEMAKEGVGTISIGTGFETSQACVALAEQHENIFACVGQHPSDLDSNSVFDNRIVDLADKKEVVAIGEVGLDYYRLSKDDFVLKTIQKTVFEYHIDLALSLDKPLMLHIRSSQNTMDAYEDALEILEHHHKISGGKLRGNAHFFAGNMEVLQRFLNIGFTVSFTGVITFTSDYDELVKATPLDMIMAETDAPFVTPVPYRGQRNSPVYVKHVIERIAELKGVPMEDARTTVLATINRVFGVK